MVSASISQYDRVCHACWLRFKRQALLTQQQDERRGLEGDETPHGQEEVEQPVDAVHVPELQPPPFLASTDERDSSVESVAAPEVHSLQSQTQQSKLASNQPKKPRPRHDLFNTKLGKHQLEQITIALIDKFTDYESNTKEFVTRGRYNWIDNTITNTTNWKYQN
ncbi:unnamed protein product [Parnassius apollo]|uniref:(apollo) hypothetical protein n=1 Tax=Parnassius apollo TaxID=110799 RepID=A0A8S3WGV4_PARAO|nr:unnamed protein product [Parnassius apollo]